MPSLSLLGCNGSHLLCSKQDATGPTAGACVVIQPGPAQRHEKTHVHKVVAVSSTWTPAPSVLPGTLSGSWALDMAPLTGTRSDHKSNLMAEQAFTVSVFLSWPQRGSFGDPQSLAVLNLPPALSFTPKQNQMNAVTSHHHVGAYVAPRVLICPYHGVKL